MADTVPPPPVPAVLRLVQTVVAGRWRATGEELYREVAALLGDGAGKEFLVVGAGEGVTVEWLASRTGAGVTGIDADRSRVSKAERRARASRTTLHLTYEHAPYEDLPHEDAVFDAVVAEPPLSGAKDLDRALGELVRVTKPLGVIVLLQPTWTSELPADTRELLVERVGLRPHHLMEWKAMLREAGVVEIQVQDWSSGGPTRRNSGSFRVVEPPPKLSWHQKMHIVGRAWRRRGWRGARGALERERLLIDELSRQRALGFQLITGVKWPHAIVK
jgi:ubiquinone/menaquinone biosynthesis C-methylase UbiE